MLHRIAFFGLTTLMLAGCAAAPPPHTYDPFDNYFAGYAAAPVPEDTRRAWAQDCGSQFAEELPFTQCMVDRAKRNGYATVFNYHHEVFRTTTKVSASTTYRRYYLGPRGGCYYINSSGNKSYVDHSLCR